MNCPGSVFDAGVDLTPEITVIYAAENTQRFTLLSIGDFG
jgi:hypothetical protein